MAGNFLAQLPGPLLVSLHLDLIKAQFPEPGPGLLDLLQTPEPIPFALGFDPGVFLQGPLENLHRLAERWNGDRATQFLMLLEKIDQLELRRSPDVSGKTLTNQLAVHLNSGIVFLAADVLQQVRHFWK